MNTEIDLEESKNLYLVLRVGNEKLATPILGVREIIEPQPVSPVANTIPFFKGVINVRGEVIGVIDLREKFKQSLSPKSVFVIVDDPSGPVAYVIDEVAKVEEILPTAIKSDIKIQHGGHHDYFRGVVRVREDMISIIDFHKLFDSRESIEFKKLKSAAA